MNARILLLGASLAACRPMTPDDAPPAPAPSDGGAASLDAGASLSPLPYPPGPYGAGVGDVMADFRVQGYALSRDQRDATKLPFSDVSLAEVRSDPECRCLVVMWTAAGHACQPCVDADQSLAAALVNDRSLCALEVIHFSYDTYVQGKPVQPPTRADLDAFVQAGRQPFPVGLLTASADTALNGSAFPGIPSSFVVRASDMRIAAFVTGATSVNLGTLAKRLCATPRAPVETVATGLQPRKLQVDAEAAFVSDRRGTVLRIDVAGPSAPIAIARPSSPPDAIAIDPANVYWATHDGPPPYEIGAVPREGGAPRKLATSDSGFTSLAVDGDYVYFTRSDGVIGRVPTTGGATDELLTGEAAPVSIVTAGGTLAWVDTTTKEVVRAQLDGTGRTVVAPFGSLPRSSRPMELAARNNRVFVLSREGSDGKSYVSVLLDAGPGFVMNMFSISSFGLDPRGTEVFAAHLDAASGTGVIVSAVGGDGEIAITTPPEVVTPGQHAVSQVRGDGKGHIYWTTDDSVRRIPR